MGKLEVMVNAIMEKKNLNATVRMHFAPFF
jgi:hypothetical protein